MLNIFFSLFLLGMLVVLCGKAIRRAMHQQQPLNSKEAALLIALSLGCLFALNAGVSAVYKTQLLFYRKERSPAAAFAAAFLLSAKKRQTADLRFAVCLLCCYFVLRSVAEIPIKAF